MSEIAGARSYADVVETYAPALLRLAIMLTGDPNDAEDLLQSTLLRCVRHAERVADMSAPAAYLRQVMLNEHLSHGRRLGRRVRTVSSDTVATDPAVPSGAETVDRRDEAWAWHTGAGRMTFHLVDWCLGQVEVRRDGAQLTPTLDPGDLTEAVEAAVGDR
ncbi:MULTISPECIES: RNA polymerase sigma factor [unclassified Nocardioides]|uniref:RNA polymerase sigma factor n=1 Tax=unclassified Nocardioides TaxID=2615069 RepID=UPI0009F0E8D1|nr:MULTISPECIES: sigma factor [unclassified Nocardioides]GAW55890.1 hypothetical protein PD653_3317 [Nocardioides sp. PD653]